jgi:hypothetical protein
MAYRVIRALSRLLLALFYRWIEVDLHRRLASRRQALVEEITALARLIQRTPAPPPRR